LNKRKTDMSTFEEICQQAEQWQAKFIKVKTLETTADLINQPHEDYPRLVEATETLINEAISVLKEYGQLTAFTINQFHWFLFQNEDAERIWKVTPGAYRKHQVEVGSHIPPEGWQVPELMQQLLPVKITEDPVLWYKRFQCIHPYADGNGRIGGIVLAALSFCQSTIGSFLAPCQ